MTSAGLNRQVVPCKIDERLREKELGLLNRLTKAGIERQYPEQAILRARIGKFYYRPPSGESWCDVILRLRSLLNGLQLEYGGGRVLVVAHQVIVLCFRYLIEGMTESQILAIDRQEAIANCSITSYECLKGADGRTELRLRLFNFVAPLEAVGEPEQRRSERAPASCRSRPAGRRLKGRVPTSRLPTVLFFTIPPEMTAWERRARAMPSAGSLPASRRAAPIRCAPLSGASTCMRRLEMRSRVGADATASWRGSCWPRSLRCCLASPPDDEISRGGRRLYRRVERVTWRLPSSRTCLTFSPRGVKIHEAVVACDGT
jgi:broad specificity phosphatase PhoE